MPRGVNAPSFVLSRILAHDLAAARVAEHERVLGGRRRCWSTHARGPGRRLAAGRRCLGGGAGSQGARLGQAAEHQVPGRPELVGHPLCDRLRRGVEHVEHVVVDVGEHQAAGGLDVDREVALGWRDVGELQPLHATLLIAMPRSPGLSTTPSGPKTDTSTTAGPVRGLTRSQAREVRRGWRRPRRTTRTPAATRSRSSRRLPARVAKMPRVASPVAVHGDRVRAGRRGSVSRAPGGAGSERLPVGGHRAPRRCRAAGPTYVVSRRASAARADHLPLVGRATVCACGTPVGAAEPAGDREPGAGQRRPARPGPRRGQRARPPGGARRATRSARRDAGRGRWGAHQPPRRRVGMASTMPGDDREQLERHSRRARLAAGLDRRGEERGVLQAPGGVPHSAPGAGEPGAGVEAAGHRWR